MNLNTTSVIEEQDKKFLDESRVHHDALVKTGEVSGMNLEGMVQVMRKYFEPDMYLDRSIAIDIIRFVKRLYGHYDKYLADPPAPKFTPGNHIYFDRKFKP